MEKVDILNVYKCGDYVLYEVKPASLLEYGSINRFYCFDYASLAKQWTVTKETLDTVSSYDLQFKQSMYENHQETANGLIKTRLIKADVISALLKKLMESAAGQQADIDIEEQLFLINLITKGAKKGDLKW